MSLTSRVTRLLEPDSARGLCSGMNVVPLPPMVASIERAHALGLPILWRDGVVVHACDGTRAYEDVVLIWTLCGPDVPPDQADLGELSDVNCRSCLAILETDSDALR